MFLFRALASGSSGNAYLLRTDRVILLFEAGLRLPVLCNHLAAEGVAPEDLSALLVTHEHRDHCQAAGDLTARFGTPVVANEKVLKAAGLRGERHASVLAVGQTRTFGDVDVTTFEVSHDAVCPVGFSIRTGGRTIVLATDLGNDSAGVIEAVREADLVVLEANHDPGMLQRGRYPMHLRRRVSGPTGHLSNGQAAGILARHVKGDRVGVWLAHLSKENNTPSLAQRTVHRALQDVGLGNVTVDVALRDRPSVRWNGHARPRQLTLFGVDA